MRVANPRQLRELMGHDFTMSDEQWEIISAPLDPAVVIAGAGSGKTEVMAARVVYLVANGLVRPDQVLGLTFTTKATGELSERVRGSLARAGLEGVNEDGERSEPTIATYNAYASALLRDHGLRIGHEPDLRVMGDAARYQLAARVIEQHHGQVESLSEHPDTVIGMLLKVESEMSEHLVSVSEVREFHADLQKAVSEALERAIAEDAVKGAVLDPLAGVLRATASREELMDLVERYRDLKQRYGLIDYSDQISGACRLAEGYPDVGASERERYAVVLLDEYQDTSVAQARMLSTLYSGADVESGRGHPVMAVGDPNQAIYGWRGASASNISRFGEDFPQLADAEARSVYSLTVNRRSERRILTVANRLAQPLINANPDAVRPLAPKPEAGDGDVRTIRHLTHADELAWLAEEVPKAHEQFGAWSKIGVLVRTNEHASQAYDVLTAAEIPVEIVGLGGLIRLPEVAGVVATLDLINDLTANASLLTLLTSPRWAIGPQDLALLGKRSAQLAVGRQRTEERKSLRESLQEAVAGSDPVEVAALCDALADPGDLPYSLAARERFAELAEELRRLRTHAGDPLLDLVRRIVDVTGIDEELASSLSPAAAARRDNLELFVKAVAEFQAFDGEVTLPALLAWLQAEDDGHGLDAATPSEANSVKLLTIHRAKGLEFDAVFCIGVNGGRFPNQSLRSTWTTTAGVLPTPLRGDAADLPQCRSWDRPGLEQFNRDRRSHLASEELRLGYVAFTRARHLMWVSSQAWGPRQRHPFPVSEYQQTVVDVMSEWGSAPTLWCEGVKGDTNPSLAEPTEYEWPVRALAAEAQRRREAAKWVPAPGAEVTVPDLDDDRVRRWDDEITRLLAEREALTASTIEVARPATISATALARLRDDPQAFAAELGRPMPRPPVRAARFGTRFHAWIEARFGQQQLLDPDELPGRADSEIESDSDLAELIARFEQGPFATRTPHAVEAPFGLVLGGQVVRGFIDAVYAEPDGSWLVVDWKTGKHAADPLQLAIYRLAWAELQGVAPESVAAAFHYVRTGETVRPEDLLDRPAIEALLG